MDARTRNEVVENYLEWSQDWALNLAFVITQSIDKAEDVLGEALVAIVTSAGVVKKKTGADFKANSLDYAKAIWDLSQSFAFRGFGADAFFRMPAVARAVVVLKTKARFSRAQIAKTLSISEAQVDLHLENSRLLFSDGKPWVEHGPQITVRGDSWIPNCPQWKAISEAYAQKQGDGAVAGGPALYADGADLQKVFAEYLGNDLDKELNQKLHAHLALCDRCRGSFTQFKRSYSDWTGSFPSAELETQSRKHLKKITKQALSLQRSRVPNVYLSLRQLMIDVQVRSFLMGMATLAVLYLWMRQRG